MRLKPLIAVPLIAIALAGCSTQQPEPQASSTSAEEKPLFASDEEALAAAQAAYAHYLEVSDQIARDGGANPERLKSLVSDAQYESELEPLIALAKKGGLLSGETTFDSMHLQAISTSEVVTYLCLDNSEVFLRNSDGTNTTPGAERWPLLVSFARNNHGNLVLSGSETWTGTNFC